MKTTVSWIKVELAHRQLADRRTADLVTFWGRFVSTLTIQDLVSSAWMQGVNDVVKAEFQMASHPEDFSI